MAAQASAVLIELGGATCWNTHSTRQTPHPVPLTEQGVDFRSVRSDEEGHICDFLTRCRLLFEARQVPCGSAGGVGRDTAMAAHNKQFVDGIHAVFDDTVRKYPDFKFWQVQLHPCWDYT